MSKRLPRVITAHDISGFGRASLTTVLPVLTAMGAYTAPLTTAVLSTVTGVFEGYEMTDLTDLCRKTVRHWKKLGLTFDYLYSGFLGSPRQVDVIIEALETFPGCFGVVDPVFGDDGKLYPSIDPEMILHMRRLVAAADLITPNLTEARFLLDRPAEPVTDKLLEDYCKALSAMGPEYVVITSCYGSHGVALWYKDGFSILPGEKLDAEPHGTGDLFTSVLTGGIIQKMDFTDAVALAQQFTEAAIGENIRHGIAFSDGVAFEGLLDRLMKEVRYVDC